MSVSIGALVVRLGLDAAEFVDGMTKNEARAKKFADRLARDVDRAVSLTTTGLVTLGAAGAAAFAVLNREAEKIADFQDIAEKIGDTAEAVASLQTASEVSGVAMDLVSAASVRLTASLSKTDDESKAVAQAVKALGLEFGEFKQLSPVEQIDAVARAMAGFADGSEKTAVAVALFGKSGAELLPLLNDLADGAERQVRLTQAQIDAADAYSKSQGRLRAEVGAFVQQLTANALPAMTQIQQAIADIVTNETAMRVATDLVTGSLKIAITIFQALSVAALDVGFVLHETGRFLGAYAAVVERLLSFDFKGAKSIGEHFREDGRLARAELDKIQAQLLAIGKASQGVGLGTDSRELARRGRKVAGFGAIDTSGLAAGGGAGKGSRSASAAQSEAERYLENLQRQLERTQDLTVAETVLADIRSGRLKLANGITQEQLLGVAQQIDQARALEVAQRKQADAARELEDAQKRLTQEGLRVWEETRTPLERYEAEIERLNMLYAKGAIDASTYARAITMTGAAFEKSQEGIKKTADQVDSFAKRAAENVQDQLGESLFQAMNGNFKNIGDAFLQMINRMVAEALAANIARSLFGDLVKGGSGGGVMGGVLQAAGSFLFGGGKAIGGGAERNTMYEVAENRPEMLDVNGRKFLLMGNQRGRIDPNPRLGGAGGGVSVTNNFTLMGPVDRRSEIQVAAAAGRGLQRAVARNN